ncbi:MAG: ABC transporter substrate-binding protein [Chloroflexi bacterium]|nr:ABC transporter substrate-binding protein [Chloroflexota bacterium]
MRKSITILIVVAVLAVAFGGFPEQNDAEAQGPIVVVGSKNFNEAIMLSYIVYYVLEDAGFRVLDQTNTGTTAEARAALLNGDIDVYVEYTGTGVLLLSEQYPDIVQAQTAFDPVAGISTLSTFDLVFNDLIWLYPAPANNTYVLTVTKDFSDQNEIATMSQLADYVRDGGNVMVAGSTEFLTRPDALPAFLNTYRFDVTPNQRYEIPDAGPAETLEALRNGTNGTNVAMAFGTAGELVGSEFVVLADEQDAQPVYQPAPVFRGDLIRENPDIATLLQPVFASLDARTLQRLNAGVAQFGDTPQQAAMLYLQENGFID